MVDCVVESYHLCVLVILQNLIHSWEFGMKINVKKMNVMCISQKGNNKLKLYVAGQQVEQVSQLIYLDSLISGDWHCTKRDLEQI